jgi:phage shock protein A
MEVSEETRSGGGVSGDAGSGPIAAVEDAAHEAAEAIENVTTAVSESVDNATGEVASGSADVLNDRVTAMETAIQDLNGKLAEIPGVTEVAEAAEELEETVADTAEAPVQVVVEEVKDTAPNKPYFPKWWPKWF